MLKRIHISKRIFISILSFGILSLSGCATQVGCPLSDDQKHIGACASVSDSFKAAERSDGNGYSVFDSNPKFVKATPAQSNGDADSSDQSQKTPIDFHEVKQETRGHFVYQPAQIYRTWIAPYVDGKTNNLINAHDVMWIGKEGHWDVPVSYDSGQANEVLSPAITGA